MSNQETKLQDLISHISNLKAGWLQAMSEAKDLSALDVIRIEAMGKKGPLSQAMRQLGSLNHEERQEAGKILNEVKSSLAMNLKSRQDELNEQILNDRLAKEVMDISLSKPLQQMGCIHPITQTINDMIEIFHEMGFSVVEGPDIEDDYHNFTALNFPADHPARQMHDTFYMADEKGAADRNIVLRTHTSPGQVRTMQSQPPPIRVIVPGRTYRSDSDMTHTPMFHQLEGLVIDKRTHFGHLKGCLRDFCRDYFELDDVPLKFRPSYFPFTEPSAEVDIGYRREGKHIIFGHKDAWMEILGCGMVHPNVLRMSGIDPDEYQGFAFGMGVERLAMLKYGIGDLRTFFEGDVRWLDHYGFSPLRLSRLMRPWKAQNNGHVNRHNKKGEKA